MDLAKVTKDIHTAFSVHEPNTFLGDHLRMKHALAVLHVTVAEIICAACSTGSESVTQDSIEAQPDLATGDSGAICVGTPCGTVAECGELSSCVNHFSCEAGCCVRTFAA